MLAVTVRTHHDLSGQAVGGEPEAGLEGEAFSAVACVADDVAPKCLHAVEHVPVARAAAVINHHHSGPGFGIPDRADQGGQLVVRVRRKGSG